MKIFIVAGARPNFVKIAPVLKAMDGRDGFEPVLVHTGQHYDFEMSQSFFDDLGIRKPDVFLDVGSASHAEQTSRIMTSFEGEMEKWGPDLVVVVGDVNSTMGCALVSVKMHVPVAHVEAGLRSFDRRMPEEINRLVTDSISRFLFVSEPSGAKNLRAEGVAQDRIHFVGNVMIDTLVENIRRIQSGEVEHPLGQSPGEYAALTLHRPSNVDNAETLSEITGALLEIASGIPIFFPAHPRTVKNIRKFGLEDRFVEHSGGTPPAKGLILMQPLGYLQFQALTGGAKMVLTDSGGIQEETTYLGIPCITIRENTERPVTVDVGTNVLVGQSGEKILAAATDVLEGRAKKGSRPELWDGGTAGRISEIIEREFSSGSPGL